VTGDPYSPLVRRLFAEPRHAGRAGAGANAYAESSDARVELRACVVDGVLTELGFRAWGCPHLIAACEYVCDRFEGAGVDAFGNFEVRSLVDKLSMPVEKTGRLLVLEDAIRDLTATLQS